GCVLGDWGTSPRGLVHLARGVAHFGGARVVGSVGDTPGGDGLPIPPGRHEVNSAQRLAGVHRRLRLEFSDAALSGLPGRTVVLVDDVTDSGWTLAVAARLLRQAGAAAVYPFVLAQR